MITVALIVINVIFFVWQLSFPTDRASSPQLEQLGLNERDQTSIEYGAIPYRITHPGKDCFAAPEPGSADTADIFCDGTAEAREARSNAAASGAPVADLDEAPWFITLFSSMFMHGGIFHIGFNMLFLWVFGNNIEDSMGRPRFVAFYLAAGVAAVYAQALIDTGGTTPTIGASGAVAGVLGGYAVLYPRARILTLIFIIFFATLVEIPAMIMLGIWFVLQFIPAVADVATTDVGTDSVAYFAHVGGFVFGLAVIKLIANRRKEVSRAPYPVY